MAHMDSIFTGIKVLDITKVFSGPFATRCLADYGAEVLKIEDILHQDDARNFPPLKNTSSGYFEILNRNKKAVSLNLKDSADLQSFYNLCKDADVIVENMTPSTKYPLNIDYKTIYKINPRIIYASLSGRGQQENIKYYDVIAQAESGLMSLSGTAHTPMKIGPAVVDAFSGMTLAFAISSALFYRERTGKGQSIDVSMLGSAMNLLEQNLIEYSITGQIPKRTGNIDNAVAPFGAYKARDGYIVIAIGNDSLWRVFEGFLEKHNCSFDNSMFKTNDLRLQNELRLTNLIQAVFKHYTISQLLDILPTYSIPCSRINTMKDVYDSSKNYALGFLEKYEHPKLGSIVAPGQSIIFSEVPRVKTHPAPTLGKNNKDYLSE